MAGQVFAITLVRMQYGSHDLQSNLAKITHDYQKNEGPFGGKNCTEIDK